MKRYTIALFLLMAAAFNLSAQADSYENLIHTIESNNTTLQAYRQQAEAKKAGSKTGIYLANPEVEVNYLWGDPSSIGNRTDVNVRQSFDFPTAYHYKSKVADGQSLLADAEYQGLRKELLLQVSKAYVDLVYCNAMKVELEKRLQHAQSLAASSQTRLSKGDADVLERNKAQLNLLKAKKSLELNEVERAALQAELVRLNGGKPLSVDAATYPAYALPPDFEQWYAEVKESNPTLQTLTHSIELSRQQEKLNRAMSLPKFSAGYMSERILGTTLQGISVGMSIPLWENKNTVKHAKAQTAALQNVQADAQQQLYGSLKAQYDKVAGLQKTLADYRSILQPMSSGDLLKKALDQGQLSLISYLMELSVYYDVVDDLMSAERDCQLAIAELRQWEV